MNKKWLRWFMILLVVAGGALWLTTPSKETYGEGYSEERRRQWNERAEAMSVAYMGYVRQESIYPVIFFDWECEVSSFAVETKVGSYLPGYEPEDYEEVNEGKSWKEESVINIFPQESVFSLPDGVNLSGMPESGWTEEELTKIGKLHLAERPFMIDVGIRGEDVIQGEIPKEVMLSLYGENGGQAHEFLFNILMDKKRDGGLDAIENRHYLAQEYPYGYYQEDREEAIRNTYGYEDFLKEVDEGNYEMYYLFKSLIGDKYVPSLESRLRQALGMKARAGDAVSQRQLGKCMIHALQGYMEVIHGINRQYSQIVPWRKCLYNKLPAKAQSWLGLHYSDLNYQSVHETRYDIDYEDYKGRWYDLSIYHDYEEGLSWCQKAAEQGDMEAKFLWVSGSPYMPRFYSREEWERSLKYTRELLEKGYAPMLLAVVMRRDLPFHFYYPREHRQSIMDAAWKSLMERGCYYLLVMDAGPDGDNPITSSNINSPENIERLKRICRIFPTGIMRFFPGQILNKSGVRREFFPYIEQSAELWNLDAMELLKHLYASGDEMEKDDVKAEKYRKRLEKSANMGNYPF